MKGEAAKRSINTKKLVRALITGTVTGSATAFVLILVSVFAVIKSGTIPYGAIVPLVIAAEVTGAFFGGFVCAKINRRTGMILGSVCGVLLFFVFFISGALSGGTAGMTSLLRLLLCILSGAFGGVMGVRKIR